MSRQGESALHYATATGNLPLIQLLLDSGVNKYLLTDTHDETPLLAAKRLHLTDAAQLLTDQKLPALHNSIRNGRANSIVMFMKEPEQVNKPDANGLVPLHHALTINNYSSMSNILLQNKGTILII
jgi:ankyrin repeat protein